MRKSAFDEFGFDAPGQPLRGMDTFTDYTQPVSQQSKDYANGLDYKYDDKYKAITNSLADITKQYPSLRTSFSADDKYKLSPRKELGNPFYQFYASRTKMKPVQWGDYFGTVTFKGDPVAVRTDLIYNQGNNIDPSTGTARSRDEILRTQASLYKARQATRRRGWLNLRKLSPYFLPRKDLVNLRFYPPYPVNSFNAEIGADSSTLPVGRYAKFLPDTLRGDPRVATYRLAQDTKFSPDGKLLSHRARSYGNANDPGELSFSDIVNWRSNDTWLHEGVPGVGHKDTALLDPAQLSIYPSGLAHDAATNAGIKWHKNNPDKVRRLYDGYGLYSYHDPSYPESTLNYYRVPNELSGLNSRMQLMLSRHGYDVNRFTLTPEKAPVNPGEYWDMLSALQKSKLIRKHPATGYYGVISSDKFGEGPMRRREFLDHYDLYSWVAHANRLTYLESRIKSGRATRAERKEFKRVLANMQDISKQ